MASPGGPPPTHGPAFQQLIPHNHCWGCGPLNTGGLHLKSYWLGDEAVSIWQPGHEFMAGPTHILNGGIIATIIDCHSVCTAIAAAYREEGRAMDTDPLIWYATGRLDVTYLRPTPIHALVTLRAAVEEIDGRKTRVRCTLHSEGEERARAEVLAIRVPEEWRRSGAEKMK